MPSTQPSDRPFTFIIGCPRSGTTLLRAMLNSHSKIAVPPESYFIISVLRNSSKFTIGGVVDRQAIIDEVLEQKSFKKWGLDANDLRVIVEDGSIQSVPETVAAIYSVFASLQGKAFSIDKTPQHTEHVGRLSAAYPNSRFVHLVRDGRDVVPSLQAMPYFPPKYGDAARYWRGRVLNGRAALSTVGAGRYYEVRYEDLLAEPERELRGLCAFLGLVYEPEMLTYHERAGDVIAGMGTAEFHQNIRKAPTPTRDWRIDYDQRALALFEAVAGDALKMLGYEPGPAPSWRQRAHAQAHNSLGPLLRRFKVSRLRAGSRLARVFRRAPQSAAIRDYLGPET